MESVRQRLHDLGQPFPARRLHERERHVDADQWGPALVPKRRGGGEFQPGCDAVVIPHNSNLSAGNMFSGSQHGIGVGNWSTRNVIGPDNVTNNNSYDMFKEMQLAGKLMALHHRTPNALATPNPTMSIPFAHWCWTEKFVAVAMFNSPITLE